MAGLACCKKGNTEDLFPETLKDFGYEFKDGKMRNIETGEGFKFGVKEGDQAYNQKHYEAIGEIITEEVYTLLKTECGLKQLPVPCDAEPSEPSTFVFASEDALSNPEKLLILIHGSGVVRAGQWARRLIINDTLDSGTQLPFIKEAQKDGYGVLVMNTNDNYRRSQLNRSKIRGSETPECHAQYVWEQYINPAKAKHIAIIAHSYGGCVTTSLFKTKREELIKRVFCVAMTDSVHFLSNPVAYKELVKVSRNWVCSQQPLDAPVSTQHGDIKRVSAGIVIYLYTVCHALVRS
ncbi:hypothetical protein Pcinc_031779 [Petrolisthes cinctipes]|uniref:Arb2 domain-containing protein n=1 Tax=Petrolisthes cinctipes TaxID=88211 RepID=A0AAE1EVZ9_PETCI|nr:hypothetical protein Pcinc_031779 [Petrolisthes cinctipes]